MIDSKTLASLRKGDKVKFTHPLFQPGGKPPKPEVRFGRFIRANGDYHYFEVLQTDNPKMKDPDHEVELYPGEFEIIEQPNKKDDDE